MELPRIKHKKVQLSDDNGPYIGTVTELWTEKGYSRFSGTWALAELQTFIAMLNRRAAQ